MSGVELARRPSRQSLALVVAAGTVAGGALAAGGGGLGALVVAVGVAVVVVGAARARHSLVDVGGFLAFAGVAVGGIDGRPVPVLVAAVATVVAWDAGGNAVSLGRQLGRRADTTRVELLHALASAAVGLTAAALAFALFRAGPTGQPTTTLFVLLVAGALLVAALNRA